MKSLLLIKRQIDESQKYLEDCSDDKGHRLIHLCIALPCGKLHYNKMDFLLIFKDEL